MDLFVIILGILFVLAISDLMVGVSNDAVNFLNSAIGAKVAPRYIILIVASLGILIGTTFSSGLMEVARKGIFNPEMFYFSDIMTIFLAVMFADVLLLDLYNTFGLPTSTTVSIVFDLLGAAVAISILKVANAGANITEIINYINTSKALAIISGILISVVVAFTVGAAVQFITRLVFTFEYEKRVKRYGAIFGSISLTAISFFILLKGTKGASFITSEMSAWIESNIAMLMVYSVILWAVIFQFIIWFTKFNILKPIVLLGTFALALAFAANDLVNFIGVPLAGLTSYNVAHNLPDPVNHLMVELKGAVTTPTSLLLLAGAVMVAALWFSKKAQTVTKTELNLGRQDEGFERFESSTLSRIIVRMSISFMDIVKAVTPNVIINFINKRFETSKTQLDKLKDGDAPTFDLLRASVNLMVASILISFATSLKLPLSTTYVTFMVAMGTSLSDRAWGRESAVYRVNGVITVVAGWFFTAFMAFTVAAVFAIAIYYGGWIAITVLVLLSGYIMFSTHILHKNRVKDEEEFEKSQVASATDGTEVMDAIFQDINLFLDSVSTNLKTSLTGLNKEDRSKLKESKSEVKKIKKYSNVIMSQIINSVKLLKDSEVKQGRRYGKIIASIQEIHAYLREMNQLSFDHIENNHSRLADEEMKDLLTLNENITAMVASAVTILNEKTFTDTTEFTSRYELTKNSVLKLDENQLSRIKKGKSSSRNSILYLNLLSDMENISSHINELIMVCKKNYQKIVQPINESAPIPQVNEASASKGTKTGKPDKTV
ncbi:MAG: hypothetical protein CVV23_03325 [Ignavibacteriae bacterium HGW-Ignavibacteriae-2]|jgi:phosphate/sulfate permease|nr:MAG: hypothetical protein CVV23_03325 [Ignavibacteriae bacterium HGW-Ignavibacteriae-2]